MVYLSLPRHVNYSLSGLFLFLLIVTNFLPLSAQTVISGIINQYAPVVGIHQDKCCSAVEVIPNMELELAPGDRVLIIQMKGALADTTAASESFGIVRSIGGAGYYEFATIKEIQGASVFLSNRLEATYDIAGAVQLIKVPRYMTPVVVAGLLTAKPWDGRAGGVLVFEAPGQPVELQGDIDVTGLGFQGGKVASSSSTSCTGRQGLMFYASNQVDSAGSKGEGISTPLNYLTQSFGYALGRGALGNSGGGGNNHNAGGGGGSHEGAGGNGGDTYTDPNGQYSCLRYNYGGMGGYPLSGITGQEQRVFMGGGGGSGHQGDNPPFQHYGTSGVNGGGIIIIQAASISGNAQKIAADGSSVEEVAARDGAGGAGAGGAILLDIPTLTGSLLLSAKGGAGGNVDGMEALGDHGCGGGGGGGLIWTSAPLLASIETDVAGGKAGKNFRSGSNHGAQPGQRGSVRSLLSLHQGLTCLGSTDEEAIVNVYTPVTGISTDDCRFTVTVEHPDCFAVGDKVLIIQMQGTAIVDSNTSDYGFVTSLNNAGNYEFARISAIDGKVIALVSPLLQSYSIEGKVQLIKVAEYPTTRLSYVTGKPWDGITGGVIVLSVSDTLILDGDIDISSRGFRGGDAIDADEVPNFQVPDHRAAFRPSHYGQKGEGIAFFGVDTYTSGRGAPANGGGGGNNHNAGGGGGANAGCGGNGGWAYNGNGAYSGNRQDAQGIGGHSVTVATGQVFMGGGGGSGHGNNNQASQLGATDGGTGGGIIIIEARVIVGNDHTIRASGASSESTEADGTGGGGAGGSIVLDIDQYLGNLTLEAKGGNSGNITVNGVGPGGGGGGGYIISSSTSFPGNVSTDIQGGLIGTTAGDEWGNTNGCAGTVLYNTPILYNTATGGSLTVNIAPDTTICSGDRIQLRISVDGGKGIATYRWSPTTGLSDPFTATPLAFPSETTVYTVTVEDSTGCTGLAQVTVTVEQCDSVQCVTISDVVNNYSEVMGIDYPGRTLVIAEPHLFSPGDQVLLIQMQGAAINNNNTEHYGMITNSGSAGMHEFAVVDAIGTNTVTLTTPLSHQAYNIDGRVQLVRVPEYDHVIVDQILTCAPWNGKTGGVLAISANCLMMEAPIDVTGKGFQGGVYTNQPGSVSLEHSGEFVSSSSFYWAPKGEGIAGNGVSPYVYGKGSPANGGGGGNNHNAGGGGGANYGRGGIGGFGYEGLWGNVRIPQGLGGKSLAPYYTPSFNRLFMGGGGGSGHVNHKHGSQGASGGGIIVIRANTLRNPRGYSLISRGVDAPADSSYINPDGCGGGGAGGTILLDIQHVSDTLLADVSGGAGGSRINSITSSGPGGGGGGGFVALTSYSSVLSNITTATIGGPAGTTPGGTNYGAQAGDKGMLHSGYSLFGTISQQELTECKGCLPTVLQQEQLCGTTIMTLVDAGNAIEEITLLQDESFNVRLPSFQLPAKRLTLMLSLLDETIQGNYSLRVRNNTGRDVIFRGTVHPLPPRPHINWDGQKLTASPAYRYQWYLNGHPAYNGSKQEFAPTIEGDYAVTVFDSVGCRSMSDTITIRFTDVDQERRAKLNVYLYPNPAHNTLNVGVETPLAGEYNIEISNLLGVTLHIYRLTITAPGRTVTELPLHNLPNGVYYLYVRSPYGLDVRKFIKN